MKSKFSFKIEKDIPVPSNLSSLKANQWDGIQAGDSIFCETLNMSKALQLSLSSYFKTRELPLTYVRKPEGTGYRVWIIKSNESSKQKSEQESEQESDFEDA
jgi:hypothetical protein